MSMSLMPGGLDDGLRVRAHLAVALGGGAVHVVVLLLRDRRVGGDLRGVVRAERVEGLAVLLDLALGEGAGLEEVHDGDRRRLGLTEGHVVVREAAQQAAFRPLGGLRPAAAAASAASTPLLLLLLLSSSCCSPSPSSLLLVVVVVAIIVLATTSIAVLGIVPAKSGGLEQLLGQRRCVVLVYQRRHLRFLVSIRRVEGISAGF